MQSLLDSFLEKVRDQNDSDMISEKKVSARCPTSLGMKAVTLAENNIMNSMSYRLLVPTALSFLEELLFLIYGEDMSDESV